MIKSITHKNKDYKLISLLGINFSIGRFHRLGVCDDVTIGETIRLILKFNTETIIIDCTSMVYRNDQKVFEKFSTHPQLRDRKIILFNLKRGLLNRLVTDLTSNSIEHISHETSDSYFSKQKVKSIFINIKNKEEIRLAFVKELKEVDSQILEMCCQDHTKEGFQLSSTSLWTNYYIEITSIFKENPQMICWLISRICNKFRENIKVNSKVLLACTSLNSTVITSLVKESLSDSYDLDVICFDRLGPDLTLNEHSASNDTNYDSVMYLCDFIVGGTEFKILRAMLALKKLKITDVIAIGSYKDKNESRIDNIPFERIFHLLDIFPKLKYGLTKKDVL